MEPNDEENGYDIDEQDEQQETSGSNQFKLKGLRGLGHKIKNGLRKARKNTTNAVKMGIKAIFKKYAIKIALIATSVFPYPTSPHNKRSIG